MVDDRNELMCSDKEISFWWVDVAQIPVTCYLFARELAPTSHILLLIPQAHLISGFRGEGDPLTVRQGLASGRFRHIAGRQKISERGKKKRNDGGA